MTKKDTKNTRDRAIGELVDAVEKLTSAYGSHTGEHLSSQLTWYRHHRTGRLIFVAQAMSSPLDGKPKPVMMADHDDATTALHALGDKLARGLRFQAETKTIESSGMAATADAWTAWVES